MPAPKTDETDAPEDATVADPVEAEIAHDASVDASAEAAAVDAENEDAAFEPAVEDAAEPAEVLAGEDVEPEAAIGVEEDLEADAEDAGGERIFSLVDRPTPQDTEALLDWLRAAPEEATVVFDCDGVEATCTPYVLALAAASRARAAAGVQAAIANPAPAIVDAFSDLGLFQDLMKMEFRP